MTHGQMERFKSVMHHKVVITLNDGTAVKGLIQPWSQTTIYLTPLGDAEGKAIEVPIADVRSVDAEDWE